MKKLLACLLIACTSLATLSSCSMDSVTGAFDTVKDKVTSVVDTVKDKVDELLGKKEEYNVEKAVDLVDSMYIDKVGAGRVDYEVSNSVMIGSTKYTVVWSVDVAEDVVKLVVGEESTKVVVSKVLTEDTDYKLTATVTAPDGTTGSVYFNGTVLAMPSIIPELISAKPVEGTAYKLYVWQDAKKVDCYFNGVQSGFYFSTDADINESVNVYVKYVEGSDTKFNIYFEIDGKTQYIGVKEAWHQKNSHWTYNVALDDEPVSQFEYSEEYKTIVTTVPARSEENKENPDATEQNSTETLHLGANGTYTTISAYNVEEFGTKDDVYVGGLAEMIDTKSKTAEEKIAFEKNALKVSEAYVGDASVTLPLMGTRFANVAIAWTENSDNVSIDAEGVMTVTAPAAATTFTLTATFTCEGKTDTLEITVSLKPAPLTVTAPVEGVAYTMMMEQVTLNKTLYITNTAKATARYLNTSEYAVDACDVYAEKTGEAYKFYTEKDNTKLYLKVYLNSEGKTCITFAADGTNTFSYDAPLNCWYTTVEDTTYAIGTYSNFNTVSASKKSYYTEANTGVEQFPVQFMTKEKALETSPTKPEGPALPEANSLLTIEKALEIGAAMAHNTYTENKYYVVGTITEVKTSANNDGVCYGNMTIKDEAGKSIYVYGTYDATGENMYGAMANAPVVGDTVKLYGIIGQFSGTPQLKNAWIVEVTPGTGEIDPDEVVKATGDSFTIESYATANNWTNGTLYETVEHEFYTVSTSGTPAGDYGLNTGKYYADGQTWRIYQSENGTVTFTAVEGKTIETIKVTYVIKNTGILTFNDANVESGEVVTVNATTATFGVGQTGTVTNGQVRITAIEVILAEEEPEEYLLTIKNLNPLGSFWDPSNLRDYETPLTEGSAINVNRPTIEGATFKGYFTYELDENYERIPESRTEFTLPATITENIMVWAEWDVTPYTITFKMSDGTVILTTKFGVIQDTSADIKNAAGDLSIDSLEYLLDEVKGEYQYSIADETTVPEYGSFELEDYTFIVNKEPAVYQFTILNYDPTGDNPTYWKELTYGSAIGNVADPEDSTGLTFKGYVQYVEDPITWEQTKVAASIPETLTEDVTIYADWEIEVFTLTIKYPEGYTPDPYLTNPIKFGAISAYENGVNIESVKNLTSWMLGCYLPQADENYVYVWKEPLPETFELKDYTLEIEAKDAFTLTIENYAPLSEESTLTSTIEYGATLSVQNPTNIEGATFSHFAYVDGTKVENLPETLTENLVLVAVWDVDAYTVTIACDDENEIVITFGAIAGETENSTPIVALKDLATAIEEAIADKAGVKYTINEELPEFALQNYEFTAKTSYALTLRNGNPMMGGTSETLYFAAGAELSIDPLTADGKTFKGWFDLDNNPIPETMPAEPLAFFANWEIIPYTVTITYPEAYTAEKRELIIFGVEYTMDIMYTNNNLPDVIADIVLADGYSFKSIPETFALKNITLEVVHDCVVSGEHTYADNTHYCVCGAVDPDHYFQMSIPDALAAADGWNVEVSGTVSVASAWNTTYGNMSVTIVDEDGNELYVYRLATEVALGDIITVKGTMATYNGRQIGAGATAEITGHDTSYDVIPEYTIPDALAAADNTNVIVTGTVVKINTAYSSQYNNISVTIADDEGNQLYIYRLTGEVTLNQIIKVTGAMATYEGARQIAAGATFEAVGTHTCSTYTDATCAEPAKCVVCGTAQEGSVATGEHSYADPTCTTPATCTVCGTAKDDVLLDHTYVEGVCSVCGATEGVTETTVDVDFSTISGTQYADETHVINDNLTISTQNEGCHFNTQLRIYDSSSNDGNAILTCSGSISSLSLNMGYKKTTVAVYGSTDGVTWEEIGTITTTSTSYLDYALDIDESKGYTYLKLDPNGGQQLRIKSLSITMVG